MFGDVVVLTLLLIAYRCRRGVLPGGDDVDRLHATGRPHRQTLHERRGRFVPTDSHGVRRNGKEELLKG